jgi:hypothetical protein
MSFKLGSTVGFDLRRMMRTQPALCAAILVALSAQLLSAFALLGLHNAIEAATAEQTSLRRAPKIAAPVAPFAGAISVRESLQPFHSAQLVEAFNEVADRIKLPLGEISFTLDDTHGQPFLRYRASLSVLSKYGAMRRFVDGVHASLTDVSLDSVSCGREAISSQALKCDLVFSVFYMRGERD